MGFHISILLRSQGAARQEAVALVTEDGAALSYSALDSTAHSIAAAIASIRPSASRNRARIGIILPNGANLAVTLLGVAISAEACPFNPASKLAELEGYFSATGIDALIVDVDENGPAIAAAEKLGIDVIRLLPGYRLDIAETADLPSQSPDDVALVLMTSGSTGRPKIVPLSHRNVCVSALDVCNSISLTSDDRCLSMWEQYHIGGLVDLLLAPLSSGGTVIVTRGFDAEKFFQLLESKKPTWFQGVPTTLNELMFHAQRHSIVTRPSSLRLLRSVAAALDPRLMQELEELFGVPVVQTFGMTEAGPLISSTGLVPGARKPRSVGRSCGTEIRVVGPAGEAAPGETGEIAVRGPNVFSGYENDLEANTAQFRDGWFHTGDTGYLDKDGDLFLTGRIKQLINRGGEKINPQEVDDALLQHPAVAEAAAFATQHRTLGEDVAAAIVLRNPATVEEIRTFLHSQLASFKVPSRLTILDRLPRNPVGKIDRLALAAAAADENEISGSKILPRNKLESWLALLWSKELRVDEVGVSDDFAALGGDSLSSLRVLVAIETYLKITLPDDIFADFSTVAGLAARLEALGAELPTAADASDKKTLSEEAGDILKSIDVGVTGTGQAPDAMLRSLQACSNEIEFRIVADAVTLYSTPAELQAALSQMRGSEIGSRSARKLSVFDRLRLRFLLWRWRRQIGRELQASGPSNAWQRQQLTESVVFYSGGDNGVANKALLIGFTGNYMRLMVPTYRVLCALDPEKADLLLLSDPFRACFHQGLEDIGDDLDAIGVYLSRFAEERGYQKTVALGTSAGGLAALHTALVQRWSKAVAVGCAAPNRHREIATELAERASLADPIRPAISLVLSGGNRADKDAAMKLSTILPQAKIRADERFKSHNFINEIEQRGELPRFLEQLLS